jgi:hypothetical protein
VTDRVTYWNRQPYTAACPCGFPDAEWLGVQPSSHGEAADIDVVSCPVCDNEEAA